MHFTLIFAVESYRKATGNNSAMTITQKVTNLRERTLHSIPDIEFWIIAACSERLTGNKCQKVPLFHKRRDFVKLMLNNKRHVPI